LTKGSSDVSFNFQPAARVGSELGIDATKKLSGEKFKGPWSPLIKMDEATQKKIDALFGK
jgi:3-polyprenyl-4-hydroxybenzoate decarboxylase